MAERTEKSDEAPVRFRYLLRRRIFTPTFFDILKENTRDKYRDVICLIDKKVIKGARRMPWISEAKKDVISCDKLRGSAHMN